MLRYFAFQEMKGNPVFILGDEHLLGGEGSGHQVCKGRQWVIADTALLNWLILGYGENRVLKALGIQTWNLLV